MNAFMEFTNSWTFIITMGVLLLGLIGLLIFLRTRPTDED
jgi:hypothetical protein